MEDSSRQEHEATICNMDCVLQKDMDQYRMLLGDARLSLCNGLFSFGSIIQALLEHMLEGMLGIEGEQEQS